MSYGLLVYPDDGQKAIDISISSRVLSYLGRYDTVRDTLTTGDNVSWNVTLNTPGTGGTAVVIPNIGVFVQQLSNNPRVDILRGITVSGSTMTVSGYLSLGSGRFNVSVFEIPSAQSGVESYGIAMSDSANFMALTDVSRFGYVTYRGTIDVNGTWDIPTTVPNRDTCVVFARFNSTATPLWHDRDTNQLRTYTGFGSNNGSVVGGSITGIQIVIVSTGFVPENPSSGYGVVIRNASGVNTYSSKYPPVIWRGGYFGLPFYIENSTGDASKIQWNAASGNVSLPMVPLGSYGFQCGDFSTTGTFPQKVALYSGLLMSGNSISTYRAKPANGSIYYAQYPVRAQIGYNLPCIDAADYF